MDTWTRLVSDVIGPAAVRSRSDGEKGVPGGPPRDRRPTSAKPTATSFPPPTIRSQPQTETNPMTEQAPHPTSETLGRALDRFLETFDRLDRTNLHLLDSIYAPEVVFEDPLHRVEGIEALRAYCARLYDGVVSCRFHFTDRVLSGDRAAVQWTMEMRHARFRPRETLRLPGASFLRFRADGLVDLHRDHFDAGAMIYERVPVLGAVVRAIKARV